VSKERHVNPGQRAVKQLCEKRHVVTFFVVYGVYDI